MSCFSSKAYIDGVLNELNNSETMQKLSSNFCIWPAVCLIELLVCVSNGRLLSDLVAFLKLSDAN